MNTEDQERAEQARRIADRLAVPVERIKDTLARSPELREICDEYEISRAAVERRRAAEGTDRDRSEEFEAISRDLEAEIARVLAQDPDAGS